MSQTNTERSNSAITEPNRTNTNVGILLFDDVELLDFAGPFEVFHSVRTSRARSDDSAPFQVFTFALSPGPVRARGGLVITPHVFAERIPRLDILVVPGGWGTRALIKDEQFTEHIRRLASVAGLVLSVCTGALLLAKAGLLKNRRATTHHAALDLLAAIDSTIQVDPASRIVDDFVVTSGGVSAGIDAALYVVEKFCGTEVALDTASYLEYRGSWKKHDEVR